MITKKRGQVTVFIIIGVILIIAVALFMVLKDDGNLDTISTSSYDTFDDDTLNIYVTHCMQDITFDGINDVLAQGGYYQVNVDAKNPYPTKGNGVWLGDQFVPFWYYFHNNELKSLKKDLCMNSCDFEGENNIETELEKYLDDNINRCLLDFEPLSNEYEVMTGEFESDIKIRLNDILISSKFNLKAEELSSGKEFQMKSFTANLPVNLNEIYGLANSILEEEINANVFETRVLNFISLYSGRNEQDLPPMSDMQFSGHPDTFWMRTEVEDKIKSSILPMVSSIQVANAKKFNPRINSELREDFLVRQGIDNSMAFIAGERPYDDIEANFLYPDSPIELSIGGSELIRPKNTFPLRNVVFDMIGFTMYDWSFDYDIAFPVIVTLRQENVYNGKDIVMRYAIEGNIKNNVPVKSNMAVFNLGSVPELQIDDPNQLINKTIKISTSDFVTKEPLEDVSIYYNCINKVYIGKTNLVDREASLASKYPFCMFGGNILIEHEDYYHKPISYQNQEEGDDVEVKLEMYPIKELQFEIRKINKSAMNDLLSYQTPFTSELKEKAFELSEPINESQHLIFSIQKNVSNTYDKQVPLVGLIDYKIGEKNNVQYKLDSIQRLEKLLENKNITQKDYDEMIININALPDIEAPSSSHTLELVPGTYQIDMFMMYEGNVTIPESTEDVGTEVLGVCVANCEEVTYPEQNFTVFPQATLNYEFEVTEEFLYKEGTDTIIFFVPDQPLPTSWDDFMDMKTDYSSYNYLFKPIIK